MRMNASQKSSSEKITCSGRTPRYIYLPRVRNEQTNTPKTQPTKTILGWKIPSHSVKCFPDVVSACWMGSMQQFFLHGTS